MTQHIILAGSTGLVGQNVKAILENAPDISLLSLVRHGAKTLGKAVDFEQLCAAPENVLKSIAPEGVDMAICCLGTTLKAAGSKEGLFRVDHDYVLAVAKGAKACGARQFILVSAAWAGGPGFYLQTKGNIERAVAALDFDRLDIIRPGFLVGARNDHRPGEKIGMYAAGVLKPLLFGPLARFGPISAQTVASAIASLTRITVPGRFIHENDDIRHLDVSRGIF